MAKINNKKNRQMTLAKQKISRVLSLLPLCLAAGTVSADNDTLRITAWVAATVTISPVSGSPAAYSVDSNAPTSFTLVYNDPQTFVGQGQPQIEVVTR